MVSASRARVHRVLLNTVARPRAGGRWGLPSPGLDGDGSGDPQRAAAMATTLSCNVNVIGYLPSSRAGLTTASLEYPL